MKHFKKLFLLLILPLSFLFVACEEKPYVTNIEKTASLGNLDTYTVTYSDGSTSFLTVTNGEDGENSFVSLDIIKEYCTEKGITLEQFFADNLTLDNPNSVQTATNKAIQSCVSVWCEYPVISKGSKTTSLVCGSGVIYNMDDTNAYIITNYHVIYNASSTSSNKISSGIHVFQYGTSENITLTGSKNANGYPTYHYPDDAVDCEVVGGSIKYDIAILKVSSPKLKQINENVCEAKIASSYSLAQDVIAIGNPECNGLSVTSGIISKESEYVNLKCANNKTVTFREIRIDTPVNGGNSGGGLFNLNAELVGIVNAKEVYASNNNPIENMGYALPFDNVTKVADNIIEYHKKTNSFAPVKQLDIGVNFVADNYSSTLDENENVIYLFNQAVVKTISTTSTGYTAGLRAKDVITKITIENQSGQKTYNITKAYQVDELMITARVGDKFYFYGKRDAYTDILLASVKVNNGLLIDADELI